MQLEVNQQNLYLFLPGKVANVAAIIADHDHCTMLEAMQRFYASPVYRELEQEDTKLWHLGAVALWEMMGEERRNGIFMMDIISRLNVQPLLWIL